MENATGYILLGALVLFVFTAILAISYVLHLSGLTWYVVGFIVISYGVGRLVGYVALGEGEE